MFSQSTFVLNMFVANCRMILQWNLSNVVTWGPKIFGLIRQVAALQKTSLKRSCEVFSVIDLITKVLAPLKN